MEWKGSIQQLNLAANKNGKIYDIHINELGQVFMVGGERYERNDFYQSSDNGQTWSLFHYDATEYSNKAVFCITEHKNKLFASGYDGKIFENNSLQATGWQLESSEFWNYSFTGIHFTENGNAFFAGNWGYPHGLIVKSDENLVNKKIDSFPYAINDIAFADDLVGYAVGYGALLQTKDGGLSWKQLNLIDDNYRSIFIQDKDNIWTVGFNGSIVKITEEGTKFNKIKNGQNPFSGTDRYLSIQFNKQQGYITGEKGIVLQTLDNGKTWHKMKKFTSEDLYSVAIHPNGNSVYFAGANNVAFIYNRQ
ncbi:MAG TPA: YCF48-related protein [Edaphocola sp.]|nr:YCF48-related protein [Edaphocola sp.]